MKFRMTSTCRLDVSVVDAETMKPGEYSILDEFPSRILFKGDTIEAEIYHDSSKDYFDLHLKDGSRGYMLLAVQKDLFEAITD